MDIRALMDRNVAWQNTETPFLFSAAIDGSEVRLRLNDFPEEPLCTVIWEGGQQDLNSFGKNWTLPKHRGE